MGQFYWRFRLQLDGGTVRVFTMGSAVLGLATPWILLC
jgi:hypothetical protein